MIDDTRPNPWDLSSERLVAALMRRCEAAIDPMIRAATRQMGSTDQALSVREYSGTGAAATAPRTGCPTVRIGVMLASYFIWGLSRENKP